MPVVISDVSLPVRSHSWKWWVCGLLLLATMVNYMDRLTLNQMSLPIMAEFDLQPREYGQLESAFGVAFALGAVFMGWLADRWNVRWIYPAAVLLGFLTGLAAGFLTLLICRFLLGLAESGNWPCALRTTQRILPPSERAMGNSILQSGAAIGAVLTPLIVFVLFREERPSTWRLPFLAVGVLGLLWVAAWMGSVRGQDLALEHRSRSPSPLPILGWLIVLYGIDLGVHVLFADRPSIPVAVKFGVTALGVGGVVYWLARVMSEESGPERKRFFRRFRVLAVLVVTINMTWHFFRAWLPLFLQQQHGYSLQAFGWFSMAYYLATDAGCLAAGFVTLRLARGGMPVHASRVLVFSGLRRGDDVEPGRRRLASGLAAAGRAARHRLRLSGLVPELLFLRPGADHPPSREVVGSTGLHLLDVHVAVARGCGRLGAANRLVLARRGLRRLAAVDRRRGPGPLLGLNAIGVVPGLSAPRGLDNLSPVLQAVPDVHRGAKGHEPNAL